MIELKRLSPSDGIEIYDLLQSIPREENGLWRENEPFIRSALPRQFLSEAGKRAVQPKVSAGSELVRRKITP